VRRGGGFRASAPFALWAAGGAGGVPALTSGCEMPPWDDDDDWVGTPPEGRHTRDQADPDYWRRWWPWAGAGMGLALLILVVALIVR